MCPIIFHGQNVSPIVGSIGGTINASMYGGAIYSIPIELPKGIGNMQPELEIVYNSQCGNSLLGYGWNILGISSITRTGSTLYHDGKMTTADLSDDDRFMLDGQRLILVGTSGNTEEYKTEQDEFSKIVFTKEGGYYSKCEVRLENGNIIKYGYTANSKLMSSDGNNVIKWMVSSISDRNGNTISYMYETPSTNGDIYISHITYTSNHQANMRPQFNVSFTYSDNRFDSYHYFIAGNKITSKKLLTEINVSKSGNVIETYSFTYDGNSNRMYNLLKQISLSKGNYSLNPTVIVWNTDDNDIQNNTLSTQEISSAILDEFSFVGDVNGDGYTDLITVPYKPANGYNSNVTIKIYHNDKTGGFGILPNTTITAPSSLEWVHVFDINGDGYDDIVLQTLVKTTNGTNTSYNSEIIVYESQNGYFLSYAYHTMINGQILVKVGDFLGEGNNSMLILNIMPWGNYSNSYYIDGYPSILHYTNMYSLNSFNSHIFDCGLVLTDDFTGNGKTELIIFDTEDRIILSFGIQNGQYVINRVSDDFECSENTSFFNGDFNNDGKADILFNDILTNYKYVTLSTGTGFTDPINVSNSNFTNVVFPQMQLYNCSLENVTQNSQYGINLSDIDGDGKTDIIFYDGHNRPTFFRNFIINDGINPTGDFKTVFQANNEDIDFKNQYFTMGNFMGVDHTSFIAVDPQNANTTSDDIINIYTFPSTAEVFSVHSITNGYGNQTELEYCYLMPGNDSFYHFINRPYTYNMKPVPVPLLAMKSYTDHIGCNNYKTSFEYTNFLLHRKGRGFVGFDHVKKTTSINNSLVKIESGWTETATMGNNAIALPSHDSIFICNNGNTFLSEMSEYVFDNVRCSRQSTSDGKRLIIRPAMVSQKTKHFNPDHPGNVMSVELVAYTYDYSNRKTYSNTYCCTGISNGINATDCVNPTACEFTNSTSISYKNNNYTTWIINRESEKVAVTEYANNPALTKKTVYEYSLANPYLVSSCTISPSTNHYDPLTTKTEYVYDSYGNLTSETLSAPYGIHNEPAVTTQYSYSDHRLINGKTVDPNGLSYHESYSYDVYDRITQKTESNNLTTVYTYNNTFGTDIVTINPDNVRTTEVLSWAANNNMAPSNALYYKYTTLSGKPKTTVFYDAAGNVVRAVTENHQANPIIVDTYYNDKNLPTQRSNPYNMGNTPLWTMFQYDGFGRPTNTTTPDGTVISYSYDGFTTTTATSAGNTTRTVATSKNHLGWTTNNTDASGATVTYSYYSDGKLASMTTSGGSVSVQMEYDNAGNRISLNDPDYGLTTSVYDALGRLVRQNTPKGDYYIFKYDALGRVIQKQVSGDATTTAYQYNESSHKGTLASIIHNGQRLDYTYDNLDRLTTINDTRSDTSYVTRYEYDTISQVSAKTYPSGYKVYYEYFPNGTKQKVKDSHGNTLWRADNINAYGQLLQATTGNGAVTVNQYDATTHRLTGSSTSNGIQNFAYTYDGFGNLTSRTDSIGGIKTETFSYDNLNRLTGISLNNVSSAIVYDSYGRMTDKEKDGSLVFESAVFGNSKPHATTHVDAATNIFPDNQIIEYTATDKVKKISQGSKIAVFTYGYDTQRMKMSITDTLTNHTLTKNYVDNCEFVDDNGDRKVYTYLSGPCGMFAVVVKHGGTDTISYIYKDHLGSWTTVTDSLGNVVERNSYDAWGNLRNPQTWSGTPNNLPRFDRGFTGHEHLFNFGLINMNGRMYDPVLSSFLSPDNYMQDPTTQQGFNRYAYCMYNPLKYVDPSGERCQGIEMTYLIEQMMKEFVINEWRSHYDTSMASHFVTLAMASCLFSHGEENSGSSVNHGSPLGNGGGSVEARSLGNGKYEVVKGLYDGGNTVYIVDDQGNRTGILGYTLTPYTFYDEYGIFVDNATINISDADGQCFLDDFIENMPEFFDYFFSDNTGFRGGHYDFKARYPNNGSGYGMMVDFGFGTYIATPRDLGNFTAGYFGGVNGLPYFVSRFGMDMYQYITNGTFEPPVSRIPQNIGYYYGNYHYYSLMLMNLLNYFKP